MAQRRMFSPDIVCSEEFLDMPVSSQALYFHLGMRADDDGFVQPKLIVRMVGGNEDDLKVLLAKRFLLPFDGGVVVIKHWLIHNMIRLDRYKPTRFQKEKELLKIKENRAYTDVWQPNGNQMAPQVRLGKVRIKHDSTNRDINPLKEKAMINHDPRKFDDDYEEVINTEGERLPNKFALEAIAKKQLSKDFEELLAAYYKGYKENIGDKWPDFNRPTVLNRFKACLRLNHTLQDMLNYLPIYFTDEFALRNNCPIRGFLSEGTLNKLKVEYDK